MICSTPMLNRTTSLLALMLFVTTGCGRAANEEPKTAATPAPAPAWSVAVTPLASPAPASSSEPQLTASKQGVLLSWVENPGPKATLKFAERTSSGWSEVRTVASGSDWFLSWADTPAVMRLADGTLVAEWLRTIGKPELEAYDLLLSYSKDDGKTWARPFTPHHDGTKTQHGFASLLEMPTGGTGLVWLDGRAIETDTTSPEGGAMSLRFASFDPAWKQTADTAVDARVCECCQTAAGVTSDGVITAFRDRSDKEIRDTAVSRLENGKWTPSISVHDDNWEIAACPVNGPALSASGKNVAIAWFTVKNDQGQAYAALSNDAGRSWGQPIRLDEGGSTGRVDIELLDDGSAIATWVEFADKRARFKMRRVERSGSTSPTIAVDAATEGRPNGHPHVTRQGKELVFASSATGGESDPDIKIETAGARLP
jgi:hypothetical protein